MLAHHRLRCADDPQKGKTAVHSCRWWARHCICHRHFTDQTARYMYIAYSDTELSSQLSGSPPNIWICIKPAWEDVAVEQFLLWPSGYGFKFLTNKYRKMEFKKNDFYVNYLFSRVAHCAQEYNNHLLICSTCKLCESGEAVREPCSNRTECVKCINVSKITFPEFPMRNIAF